MRARSDIQGLRALAVALVVLSHAHLFHLSGGYVGVDVFFVISGYLITSIILREYAANAAQFNGLGWFSLRAFYLRRFKRIIPVAFLVLVVTTFTSYLLFNSVKAHGIAVDAIWSALFLANVHFISMATDYFQQGFATSPLQHFWSLAVEEQFYLVFPTLLIGALSVHGIKIRNFALTWRRRVGILIGLSSLASLIWAVHATNSSPANSYFSSFSRVWELGLGALLAIFAQSSQVILSLKLRNFLSCLGIIVILFSSFLFTSTIPFPGLYTLIPTISAGLIIGSGINAEAETETLVQKISNFNCISYLGNISYSVYLWHLPILVIVGQKYAHDNSKYWFNLLLIAAILLVSSLTYNIYENPLRKRIKVPANWYQYKFRKRIHNYESNQSISRQNLGFIFIGICAVVVIIQFLLPSPHKSSNPPGSAVQHVSPTPAATQAIETYPRLLNSWKNIVLASAKVSKIPKEVLEQPTSLMGNFPPLGKCVNASTYQWCSFPTFGTKSLVILGDSHADDLELPIMYALGSYFSIYSFSKPHCMVGTQTTDFSGQPDKDCVKWKAFYLEKIKRIKPDVIMVIDNPASPLWVSGKRISSIHTSMISHSESFIQLNKLTKKIVYFGVWPGLKQSLQDCVSSNYEIGNCYSLKSNFEDYRASQKALVTSIGGSYLDTAPWFCANGICPPVIQNTVVYTDTEHLSFDFGTKLIPLIRKWTQTFLLQSETQISN